jgi:TfoX/Sxy family transcriptional regulator of competence genes
MRIPRADENVEEFFKSVLPKDPRVSLRKMFGNLAGFVNGNLFIGVYGSDLFFRLSDENRSELLKVKGSSLFEPMKGRPMKEYVVMPHAWMKQPETVQKWCLPALDWGSKLPPKKRK